MSMSTTQLIFAAPETVSYDTYSLGELGPAEVLVRTTSSGISHGTEMSAFIDKQSTLTHKMGPNRYFIPKTDEDPPPFPFRYAGYEAVGIVEQVGESVTNYTIGDRVWFLAQHMTHFKFDASDDRVQKLAPHVTDEQAVLIHLIMVALNAVLDAQIKSGDIIAVFGGGTVGQLAARIALLDGASRVYLSEPLENRRALAEQIPGIIAVDPLADLPVAQILKKTGGRHPDVVIECSGVVRALHQAIATAGVAGTVIAAGMYSSPATALHLSEEFLLNRITLKASMAVWGCPSRFSEWNLSRLLAESNRLLAENKLAVTGFVSTKIPFPQAQKAYELIRNDPQNHTKMMLTYD